VRIFLTGAGGFVGRVLSTRLLAGGHHISALVRRPGSDRSPPGRTRWRGISPTAHASAKRSPRGCLDYPFPPVFSAFLCR